MQSVEVSGRFMGTDLLPQSGTVQFIPSKLWVEEAGVAYPVPSPTVELEDGQFRVQLVRTDQHGLPWHYRVVAPMAQWSIFIDADGPLKMKNLIPKRYSA